jgi:hypothetical protein
MSGAELIAAERQRQIDVERWTPEHDAEHTGGELLAAAECYLAHVQEGSPCYDEDSYAATHWPWDHSWWKPADDPVRNLVKAGALIAAELDRLQARMSVAQDLDRLADAMALIDRLTAAPVADLAAIDERTLMAAFMRAGHLRLSTHQLRVAIGVALDAQTCVGVG